MSEIFRLLIADRDRFREGDKAISGSLLVEISPHVVGFQVQSDCKFVRRETIPTWPEPRDAKTDPPPEGQIVLAWSDTRQCWTDMQLTGIRHYGLRLWVPQLPAPTPPKSRADIAWEDVQGALGVDDKGGHLKSLFMAGYNAGRKAAK